MLNKKKFKINIDIKKLKGKSFDIKYYNRLNIKCNFLMLLKYFIEVERKII